MTDDEWKATQQGLHAKAQGMDPSKPAPPAAAGGGGFSSYLPSVGRGLLHSAADLGTGALDFMDLPTPQGGQPLPTPSHLIKQIPGYGAVKAYADAPSGDTTETVTREVGDIGAPMLLPMGKAETALQAGPAAIDWAASRYGPQAGKLAWKNVQSALDHIAQLAGTTPKQAQYAEGMLKGGAKMTGQSRAGRTAVGAAKGAVGAAVQPTQGEGSDHRPATAAGAGAGAMYENLIPHSWRLPALAFLIAAEAARQAGGRTGYVSPFLAYETGAGMSAPFAALGPGGIGALAGQAANFAGRQP